MSQPSAWAMEKARELVKQIHFLSMGRAAVIAAALDAARAEGRREGAEEMRGRTEQFVCEESGGELLWWADKISALPLEPPR